MHLYIHKTRLFVVFLSNYCCWTR